VTAQDLDRNLFEFALRMGDNCLVLGQRNSAWCGHTPVIEEDIALANVALDLIGQAKLWLTLAGEIEGRGRSADDLAFLRDAREFRNALLVEQPNGDFGQTLIRQFLFDAFHLPMLKALSNSTEPRLAEIAAKAVKEADYHFDRSRDLVIRLGDGTDESHRRLQEALDLLYPFQGELTQPDDVDASLAKRGVAPDLATIKEACDALTLETLSEATLKAPNAAIRKGGKAGRHSEEFGHMLAEMQILQRSHPGATW
jgi:ring-1,2-phenylacetyl-CoA epoxidase subunit PaaC